MNSTQDRSESATQPSHDAPNGLVLERVPGTFGISRLSPKARIPRNVHRSVFSSISRSGEELSIVCEDRLVPEDVQCERGWAAIKVAGTLDFSLIGVLASLAEPLAAARIGLFTVSTYDTDYLMVREKVFTKAQAVLEAAGHTFDLELLAKPEPPAQEPPTESPAQPAQKAASQPQPEELPARPAPARSQPAASEPATAQPSRRPKRPALEPSVDAPAAGGADSEEAQAPPRKSAFERVLAGYRRLTNDVARRQESPPAAPAAEVVEPPEDAAPAAVLAEETGPATAAEISPAPEVTAAVRVPGAAEPPASRSDDGARAEGLFTGAIPQHPVEITDKSFEELGLSGPILDTVREVGFEHPTPIQASVIPFAREGRDVIGLAQTGSGKTAAFSLPLAERLTHGRGTRGLILCPTREIALQTKAFLDIFGRDHQLETVAVIGGVKMGPQIDGFRRDADILVATPGRLADHMRRGNVRLDKIEELVLDEADHMLDLGFLPQIKEILAKVPKDRRTLMFSATMPPPIERLAQIFMHEPVRCDIRPVGQIATGIEHRLYLVKDEDRKDCLFALLREVDGSTLVFVRRKLYTEWLARQIELAGFRVARIHSDRSQAQRVQALKTFREGQVRILVATDVAARGIDVPRIQHVVNYGLPEQTEDYVHRAGRTARGSAAGVVSTIGTWQDKLMVREIELDLGITMPRCTVEGIEPYVELPKRKTVRRRRLL